MNNNPYSVYIVDKKTGEVIASIIEVEGVKEVHASKQVDVIVDGEKIWTEGDRI